MVASLQEHLHEYHYIGLTLKKNIIAVITRDRVIDENLKRQIKNRTFVYLYIISTDQNFSIY